MGCPELGDGPGRADHPVSAKGGPTYGVTEAGVAGFTAPRVVDVAAIVGGIPRVVPGPQVMTATSEPVCAPLWPYGPGRRNAMSWKL